jgi:hypothetical protein
MLKPGDRVIWWWTADNCRCPSNGHQDLDSNRHPMADGRLVSVLTACQPPHHRVLTGYQAVVIVSERQADPDRVICALEVEMPAHIGPGSRHNLITRQMHSVLAENGRRPRSGECTEGTIEDEFEKHKRRSSTAH